MAQLPDDSRLCRADDPDRAWGADAHILRMVEYDLRSLIHGLSSRKSERPKPIDLPSDAARRRRAADSVESAMSEVDEILGMAHPKEVNPDG